MKENTNKAIAVNSLITYARIFINAVLGLFTTKYTLIALGVSDYGLFSVLGSFITLVMVVNTIMVSTSNRYLSVAIGKGDEEEMNKVFNVNLTLFGLCAVVLLMVALPLGLWYTNNYINYDGPIENARMVFVCTIIGSLLSIVAMPFHGLMMAKERFFVFSITEVIIHIIRFVVVIILVYNFTNKLLIYSLMQAFTAFLPVLIYWLYCREKFPDIVKWNIVKNRGQYREMLGFSGWVSYGAVAWVARNQGASLLVNAFFSTAMNAALGIANTVNSYVTMFANSLTHPMQPQITKSYASGRYARTDDLLVMSTKYTFMLMLLVGTPFFVGGEWILGLWLGNVPPYAMSFTVLLIIDNIVLSFNSGLSPVIFADGRIALYQVVINTLRLLAIVAAYFVLRSGMEPQSLFISYIVFSILVVFATQYCMHKTLHYDMSRVYKESYKPSILTLFLLSPAFLLPQIIHPLFNIVIVEIYLIFLELFVGLNIKERTTLFGVIINKVLNRNKRE